MFYSKNLFIKFILILTFLFSIKPIENENSSLEPPKTADTKVVSQEIIQQYMKLYLENIDWDEYKPNLTNYTKKYCIATFISDISPFITLYEYEHKIMEIQDSMIDIPNGTSKYRLNFIDMYVVCIKLLIGGKTFKDKIELEFKLAQLLLAISEIRVHTLILGPKRYTTAKVEETVHIDIISLVLSKIRDCTMIKIINIGKIEPPNPQLSAIIPTQESILDNSLTNLTVYLHYKFFGYTTEIRIYPLETYISSLEKLMSNIFDHHASKIRELNISHVASILNIQPLISVIDKKKWNNEVNPRSNTMCLTPIVHLDQEKTASTFSIHNSRKQQKEKSVSKCSII
ncbi:hypothetical protein NEFER03_0636 [Nematocida sp. LUAm3]|nr:hypothetical protein NEFER03_0636 [Nematocida sp. LUAm3]KAI5176409.1 hypothetical protein NEFER02_2180 [Nematocida sp. LUAm2]KAI5179302.1 hypothetical protein NEFER01_2150 [Nematocida sp. LUAm1]